MTMSDILAKGIRRKIVIAERGMAVRPYLAHVPQYQPRDVTRISVIIEHEIRTIHTPSGNPKGLIDPLGLAETFGLTGTFWV